MPLLRITFNFNIQERQVMKFKIDEYSAVIIGQYIVMMITGLILYIISIYT